MARSNLHMIGWVIMPVGEKHPLLTGSSPHRSRKVYRHAGYAEAIARRKLPPGTYRVESCYIPRSTLELESKP